jgi:ATP-dependent DNA helicase RecG
MRVPTEQALRGGESDCRNQTLHQLFLMINLGERAGSGLPKIRQGWEGHGGNLRLFDAFEPYDSPIGQ